MVLLLLACAARRLDDVPLDPAAPLLARGDAAWAERGITGDLDRAIAAWQEAAGLAPEDPRPLARLARAQWTRGVVAASSADALAHFEAGRELGVACLLLTPGAAPRVEAAGWALPETVLPGASPLPWDPECLVWTAVNSVEAVRERGPGAALELDAMAGVVGRAQAVAPPELAGFASYAAGLRRTLDPDASPAERDEGLRLLDRAVEQAPEVAWLAAVRAAERGEAVPSPAAGGPWALENAGAARRWGGGRND